MLRRERFSARQGSAGGMLVNKLFERFKLRNADDPRSSENCVVSRSTISSDFDQIF